jgi:methionyl-tRNA formyltransferase
LEEFRSCKADVAVVVAYGRILPESVLKAFSCGCINVHFSLLPKYRGAAPVNWAIANGETQTGVTTMQMDAGLDTGDILLQTKTAIGENENAIELLERLSFLGADLLVETLKNLDSIKPQKQIEGEATFAPPLKKVDGRINWQMPAREIAARVRAFQPFPTSYTFIESHQLTIWSAKAFDRSSAGEIAGTIVNATGDELVVACGNETFLQIEEVQLEGKRRMSERDFLNGTKIKVGEHFD